MENESVTNEAIHGHVGTDPVLKETANGHPRLSFRVGMPRRVETPEGEWVNTDPHYVTVAMYGKSAQRTAEAIQKGDQVIALGNLREYEVTDPERGPRVMHEFRASRVGHDLNLSTVEVSRRGPRAGMTTDIGPRVEEPALPQQGREKVTSTRPAQQEGSAGLPVHASPGDQLTAAGVEYPGNWNEMGSSSKDIWEEAALRQLQKTRAPEQGQTAGPHQPPATPGPEARSQPVGHPPLAGMAPPPPPTSAGPWMGL